MISKILLKSINFFISLILARILEPEDFGIVTIALITVNFFETARDFGIGSALINYKKDLDAAADTAFFLFPIIAMALYALSYLIAPAMATFFKENELTIIIQTLSLSFVIWSFGALPSTLILKDLEFKRLVFPELFPKIGYGAVAIVMAFLGFGVWSLVIGRLVLEILSVVTIWCAIRWRPSFKFNLKIALDLFNYGKYVLISSVCVFLISIIDVTIIGYKLGPESLGYYTLAFGIASMFSIEVSRALSRVLFSAYSKVQEDIEIVGQAYIKTLQYLSFVTFPAATGVVTVSWYFIKVFYGDKWLPLVTVLQVLCFSGLSTSILKVTENLYFAVGKTKTITKIKLFQLFILLILIYPLTIEYGILGSSISILIPSTIALFITFRHCTAIIHKSFLTILKSFLPAVTGSFIIGLVVIIIQKLTINYPPFVILTFSIFAGITSYLLFFILTQKDELLEIKKLIIPLSVILNR